MKNLLGHALLVLVLLQFSCNQEPETIPNLLDHYEENGRRKISSPFSGTVLVAKNETVIFKNAYGYSDRKSKTPNQVGTAFPIGSLTKQFTAMLVLQLVEEGRLQLDTPIQVYLPYLTAEYGRRVTLHHLLSNTSGLPHYEAIMDLGYNRKSFSNSMFTTKELVLLLDKLALVDAPGTNYRYSSLGFMLAGAILEEVTGNTFADLIRTKIAEPLGLKNTGYLNNAQVKQSTAKGHKFVEDETFWMIFQKYGGEFKEADFRNQSTKFAAGGMHSTVEDLFVWSQAIQNSTLLSPAMTKKMLRPNLKGYCYGWIRNWDELMERNTKATMYTHGGALNGHRASLSLYDDGTTIIFLTNVAPIKDRVLIHELYLAANGLKEDFHLKGYPDRSSIASFESAGGFTALNNYFERLSALSGYPILPSETSIAQLLYLYYEAGQQATADSIRQFYFRAYRPTESSINRLGYQFLEQDCAMAVSFFKENTTLFPESPNVWDSLGEAWVECENIEKAILCFEKAVALAKKTKDINLPLYQENLEHATALIK